MFKYLFKILIISAVLFSCKPEKDEDQPVPATVLSQEQLVKVLTEAYLAEGASGINIKNVTGQQYDSAYVFNPLKDNNIEKSKFDSTMAYYTRHPKKLKIIYDKILERLSLVQANGKIE